jgi:hypothetical protein
MNNEISTEDQIRLLISERAFLDDQLRKLATIIRNQEEQIHDLRTANQDLKFQLTQKHDGK